MVDYDIIIRYLSYLVCMIVLALVEVVDHTLKRYLVGQPSTRRKGCNRHDHVRLYYFMPTNESESLRFRCRLLSLSLSALSATVKSSPAGTGPVGV